MADQNAIFCNLVSHITDFSRKKPQSCRQGRDCAILRLECGSTKPAPLAAQSPRHIKVRLQSSLPVVKPVAEAEGQTGVGGVSVLVHVGQTVGVLEREFKAETQGKTEATADFDVQELLIIVAVPFIVLAGIEFFEEVEVECCAGFEEECLGSVETSHSGDLDCHAEGCVVFRVAGIMGANAAVVIAVDVRGRIDLQAGSSMDTEAGVETDHGVERNQYIVIRIVCKIRSAFTLEDDGAFVQADAENVRFVDGCKCTRKCR